VHADRDNVIFQFSSNDEDVGEWDSGERWLPSLLPLRDDLARGDLRSLYLGWLSGIYPGDEMEPPVTPGLKQLSGALQTLVDFLNLDPHLLTAAVVQDVNSPADGPSPAEIADWVARLTTSEKDKVLAKLLFVGEHAAGDVSDLRRRFQREWNEKNASRISVADSGRRTTAEICEVASELGEEAERHAAELRLRQETDRKRKVAMERERYLKALAPRAERIWREVESLLRTTNQKSYDKAVTWLCDLRDLATVRSSDCTSWEERVADFRSAYSRKSSLMRRFDKAGFP
jgi:hypothetical protein